ncbi:flagellar hook-basal body complex protein [Desulfovibrio mangrovi]|uniref:flagellar hook protein FlgE n=1 Tax=Desulfovibrio mangrovi TaxID=2976983 RepID=UPI002246DEDE|nr:flagellar hook-basal body complex protein [Desulfovibrio mangrovi]UZP66357.1 flagellar hook-basal body complex protein [Desulfovibrio mangrovi]
MGLTALYTGAGGMKTLSRGMQVVGNNLANVNTLGFKQQMAIYQDLKSVGVDSASVNGGGRADGAAVGYAQLGMGVTLAEVRTIHQQGAFDLANEVTDLGISGKGFFGVSKDGVDHYTRAGNFRFDKSGYLVDPHGFRLQGRAFTDGVEGTTPGDIQLATNSDGLIVMPAAATESVRLITNLGSTTDSSADSDNPFFALAQKWDGSQTSPLGDGAYSYGTTMRVYDANGGAHDLNVYFDAVQGVSNAGSKRFFEFIVTVPPSEDGRSLSGAGKGLLMSGTLTFDANNKLENMTAFVPGTDPSTLSNWTPAAMGADGLPQFSVSFRGSTGAATASQTVSLDLGIHDAGSAWSGVASNAAAVGTNAANIGGMSSVINSASTTTAYSGSSSTLMMTQDGYTEGYLMNLDIGREGIISGKYSNGESQDLFRISLYRFNNEFGLKREGNNHFSATRESNTAQEGVPDTENFGSIASNALEQSNVDMAREFVTMIATQRGFQSNSKIVSTQDQLIQNALQMKR